LYNQQLRYCCQHIARVCTGSSILWCAARYYTASVSMSYKQQQLTDSNCKESPLL